MNKFFTLLIAMLASIASMAQAPAFPGAEGNGRYTTGGRGGSIIHVTNLNDTGDGSLRKAVEGTSKKIIVFDVAGVIPLASELKIGANTTILGQTAPSPGITIRYYTTRPNGNNIIIRFIRFRRGQEKECDDGADCIWQRQLTGLILDHCSMSWSIDELASFYDNNNFTMQWCMLGEALANAGHDKGEHSYGGIWGGKLASFHHNFLGFMQNRCPRFNGARYNWSGYTSNKEYSTYNWANTVQAENVDFRNCVMYNWGTGNGCYGGPGGGYINIINNYYKAGPGTSNTTRVTQISKNSKSDSDGAIPDSLTSRYFINGNYVTAAGTNAANYDWNGVIADAGVKKINGEFYTKDRLHFYGDTVKYVNDGVDDWVNIKLNGPSAPYGNITTHTAADTYDAVLDYAGNSLFRDDVDARYTKDTKNGTTTYTGSIGTLNSKGVYVKTKGIIDIVADCNGYTEENFGTGSRESGSDTDNDGIPDEWEKANGLDSNDASDAVKYSIDTKGYYMNIEVYANALVEDIMKNENAKGTANYTEYYPTLSTTSGINNNENAEEVIKTEYLNLQGQHVNSTTKGVVIVRETFNNKEIKTKKIIN